MSAAEEMASILKRLEKEETEKFSAVVSNPPYQSYTDTESISMTSIYHLFFQASKLLAKNISMIYPAKWMLAGSGEGITEFRTCEIQSRHYYVFKDFSSSEDFFSGISIAGGLNIFLWTEKEHDFIKYSFNNEPISKRVNLLHSQPLMIRSSKSLSIVEKVSPQSVFSQIISNNTHWGDNVRNEESLMKIRNDSKTGAKVFFVRKQKIEHTFVDEKFLTQPTGGYKAGISRTANKMRSSAYARQDRIFPVLTGEITTGTFAATDSFATELEMINCIRYLKTDFSNFLFAIVTPTQFVNSRCYSLIPLLDFATGEIIDKPGTFLDFSKPETLDDQLAEIYGLTDEEQELMRKDLKPWKDKVDVEADR